MNGVQVQVQALRRLVKTVPQDDVLLAALTPKEALSFAARLTLPGNTTKRERDSKVESVLSLLHLDAEVATTRIGDINSRGLSGGQRKRESVGLEILSDPAVLLMDVSCPRGCELAEWE